MDNNKKSTKFLEMVAFAWQVVLGLKRHLIYMYVEAVVIVP